MQMYRLKPFTTILKKVVFDVLKNEYEATEK